MSSGVNIFKIITAVNQLFQDLSESMKDNFVTIDEIYKMTNDLLRTITGRNFSEIGIRINKIKTKDGKEKTKLEIVF